MKKAKLSIFKTAVFNVTYFGFFSLFRPKILISNKVKFVNLKGKISINNCNKTKFYCKIGFNKSIPFSSGYCYYQNDGGEIIINGPSNYISRGVQILISKDATLVLNGRTFIGSNSLIICTKKIEIGNDSAISFDCKIMDSDGHIFNNQKDKIGIKIGNHNWICNDVTILKNVILGDNNIVASGSKTTKTPDNISNSLITNNDIKEKDIKFSWSN